MDNWRYFEKERKRQRQTQKYRKRRKRGLMRCLDRKRNHRKGERRY